VLNAFRHHRGGRNANDHVAGPRQACSTPFGITEVGGTCSSSYQRWVSSAQRLSASQRWAGGHPFSGPLPYSGAQRLSASQRWAARRFAPCLTASECSTPFGITEVGGCSSHQPEPIQQVLNAFRHHRGGRRAERISWSWAATVLNAFRHHRGGRAPSRKRAQGVSCAQRLSASQRWAGPRALGLSVEVDVLNAFRHHRGGRYDVWLRGVVRVHVLNAFRHHRGGRDLTVWGTATNRMCSTPFGITEVGGCQVAGGRPQARVLDAFRHHRGGRLHHEAAGSAHIGRVLNAFRHHRGGRGYHAPRSPGNNRCSTPFGITEVGGSRRRRSSGRPSRAQRLSASQRWAEEAPTGRRMAPECSTPFGITEVGGNGSCSSPPGTRSAQRLSASQRWADVALTPYKGSNTVCAQRLSASQRWAGGVVAQGANPQA